MGIRLLPNMDMRRKRRLLIGLAVAYVVFGVSMVYLFPGGATATLWSSYPIGMTEMMLRDVRVSAEGDIAIAYTPIMRQSPKKTRGPIPNVGHTSPLVEGTKTTHRLILLRSDAIFRSFSRNPGSPGQDGVFGDQRWLDEDMVKEFTTPKGITTEHHTKKEIEAQMPDWPAREIVDIFDQVQSIMKSPIPHKERRARKLALIEGLKQRDCAIWYYKRLFLRWRDSDWILVDIQGPSGMAPVGGRGRRLLTPFAYAADIISYPFHFVFALLVAGAMIPH